MSDFAFVPQGNGVSINASTVSTSIQMPAMSTAMCVTNRSTTSPAWVAWGTTAPTAVFPVAGATAGSPGMEVAPGAQVSISCNFQNTFVAAVLLSGTGVISFVPGDGL